MPFRPFFMVGRYNEKNEITTVLLCKYSRVSCTCVFEEVNVK